MNTPVSKLLLVEDDTNLGFVIRDYLKICGYEVILCGDGNSAWDKYLEGKFDLCILDIMLPGKDGFSLAGKIRQHSDSIPIIFLTAKLMKEDKLEGFRIGADDYITKPFDIEELAMRINVFLKRSQRNANKNSIIKIGGIIFDYNNLQLLTGKKIIKLTRKEADLLKFLYQKKNNVVKREDILVAVWGNDDYFLGRSMDVFISKLRKYLNADSNIEIQNFHSVGFRLLIKET